ncbi:MAG: hypothetical protein QF371_05085, partial [Flavobacteriales bacterium]|nr:hypothetical protein [Flavobacteriales bacterium]
MFQTTFNLLLGLLIANALNAQTLVVNQLCNLPADVNETSGLENGPDGCFWTHNDSGNGATLYSLDTTCTIVRTISITGTANTDWEDLAKDDDGNLYIGDFGNNGMTRTDLRILVVPSIDSATVSAAVSDTIRFSYPDQHDFPPNGDYGNFDMEAFVWYNDSLHLFSKDRSNPSTGYTKRYRLPAHAGTYEAELVDSFETGQTNFIFSITAADLSTDNSKLVLLNTDRLWLFTNYVGSDFFGGNVAELEFGTLTQKEGVVFRDGFIYLTDENSFGLGGNLYRVHPSVLVSINAKSETIAVQTVYKND